MLAFLKYGVNYRAKRDDLQEFGGEGGLVVVREQNVKHQKANTVLWKFICLVTIAQNLFHHLYLNIGLLF